MFGFSSSSSYSLSASRVPGFLLADALHATLVFGVPPAGLNTGFDPALDFGDFCEPLGAVPFSADTGRSPSLASTRWMASSSEPGEVVFEQQILGGLCADLALWGRLTRHPPGC